MNDQFKQNTTIKYFITDQIQGLGKICGISHEVDGLVFYIIEPLVKFGNYTHFSCPANCLKKSL